MRLADFSQGLANVLKNGINPLRDQIWAVGTCNEVGEAGQDADVGLRAHLEDRFLEDSDVAARENLGRSDGRIGPTARLVDVAPDVRVAKEGEDTNLRHRG